MEDWINLKNLPDSTGTVQLPIGGTLTVMELSFVRTSIFPADLRYGRSSVRHLEEIEYGMPGCIGAVFRLHTMGPSGE